MFLYKSSAFSSFLFLVTKCTDRLVVVSRAREGLRVAVLSRAREGLGAAVLSSAREGLRVAVVSWTREGLGGSHCQRYQRPPLHDLQQKFRIVHVAGILKGGNFD